MKITENFTLEEMIYSKTAIENKIDNTPNAEEIENITFFCKNIMQVIRNFWGSLKMTSAFRSKMLNKNKNIKGSKTSFHMKGLAGDFVKLDSSGNVDAQLMKEIFNWCILNINFDQIIWEFGGRWIHIQTNKDTSKNRKQILRSEYNAAGDAIYIPIKGI